MAKHTAFQENRLKERQHYWQWWGGDKRCVWQDTSYMTYIIKTSLLSQVDSLRQWFFKSFFFLEAAEPCFHIKSSEEAQWKEKQNPLIRLKLPVLWAHQPFPLVTDPRVLRNTVPAILPVCGLLPATGLLALLFPRSRTLFPPFFTS